MTAPFLVQPIFRQFDNAGLPAAGYHLWTYAGGTTTPKTTYSDAAGTVPNTNPVVFDTTGSAIVRLGSGAYNFVVKDPTDTTTIWSADQYQASYLSAADVGQLLFPQSTAEIAAGVTPTTYAYIWGDVRRYGADPLGSADSTAAINNALLSNERVYAIAGTYKCSASLNLQSGQTFYGDGSATVLQFANGGLNNIYGTGISNTTVRDLKINVTGTGGVLKYGGIYWLNCSHCHAIRVEMAGCNWTGVWLDAASNYNSVRDCYFHGFSEPAGTGGDIQIYSSGGGGTAAPSYNIFEGNQCFGGGGFGVAILDPYSAAAGGYPVKNIITNNRVGAHLTYGIVVYMPGLSAGPADSFNQIANNYIELISGTCPTNNASGAGIYVVGNGAGGTQVTDNAITNCCSGTVTRSLAPAGIGVSGIQTGLTRPTVANNMIQNMSQGDGIDVVSSPGGCLVIGNSINMPSTNTGAGAGGGSLLGAGIRVEASSDVTVEANQVLAFGNGQGLYVYANGVDAARVSINGGAFTVNGTGVAFQAAQNGGFNITQFSCTGTRFRSLNAAADALSINAIIVGQLTNLIVTAVTARALFLNGCTKMRIAGGEYTSTGAIAIGTSGVCTDSFISKDANFGGVSSLINNAGTGCAIEWRVTANTVPTTGTFAVGDHAIPAVAAVGSPKGWYTTAAGTPGTQTSEGNL